MSARPTALTDALRAYLLETAVSETPEQAALREATRALPQAGMQIAPEQGQLLRLLVRLVGARQALEIGTFTGYSALSVALALPADGRLVACDISDEWTRIGRPHWEKAGVAAKIDLRLGPALATLDELLAEGAADRFDMAFIDADKDNYDGYYERCLTLVRRGGLIAVDNVLWQGRVADPSRDDPDTRSIRALNAKIAVDPRVTAALVPIGDGLTLAVRER